MIIRSDFRIIVISSTRYSWTSNFAHGVSVVSNLSKCLFAFFISCHNVKSWRHPQNRKYITYCIVSRVQGRPSYGQRYAPKLSRSLYVCRHEAKGGVGGVRHLWPNVGFFINKIDKKLSGTPPVEIHSVISTWWLTSWKPLKFTKIYRFESCRPHFKSVSKNPIPIQLDTRLGLRRPFPDLTPRFLPHYTSGSAIAEGPREALVSRNHATTKRLTWKPYRVALFAWFYV